MEGRNWNMQSNNRVALEKEQHESVAKTSDNVFMTRVLRENWHSGSV
jgi:hypothetical protein